MVVKRLNPTALDSVSVSFTAHPCTPFLLLTLLKMSHRRYSLPFPPQFHYYTRLNYCLQNWKKPLERFFCNNVTQMRESNVMKPTRGNVMTLSHTSWCLSTTGYRTGGLQEGCTYLSSPDVTREPLDRLIMKSITWEHHSAILWHPIGNSCCSCPCGVLLSLFCVCCASAALLLVMVRSGYALHPSTLNNTCDIRCCNYILTSAVLTENRFGLKESNMKRDFAFVLMITWDFEGKVQCIWEIC